MRRLLLTACVTVLLVGCATGLPAGGRSMALETRRFGAASGARAIPDASAADPLTPEVIAEEEATLPSRAQAVSLARDMIGKRSVQFQGRNYPDDCTGLVRGIFDTLGVGLMANAQRGDNGVTSIYRFAQEHGRIFTGGRPLPGDLVFFRDTYDENRDGRLNDGLTHVGLVEAVDEEGTVYIIHRVRRGVVRFRMNLEHPDDRADPHTGRPLNDFLRAAGPGQKAVLTAQLFQAYGTILPTHASEVPMPRIPVLRPQPEGGSI